ncbi:putative ribonuclease H-like domain-containing protein [Tanacetum coccineum]
MKKVSKGFSGVITPLFDKMLVQHQGKEPSIQTTPKTSSSKITSLPSLSSHHTSISSPSTSQPPITPTEETVPMPHESPLQIVHSLGYDEGSLSQNELMDLVTKLTDRIGLEKNVKTGKAKRRSRIVISEDEDAAEDSSKQGRKISDIDTDPTISLVQPQQDMEYDFDATTSIPVTTVGLKISTANIAVSTVDAAVTTASASISTVIPLRVSTAEDISGAETLVYIRRSASKAKDKEKAIMQESKPPKKIKKRVQVQMSIDEELAKKVFEEEQAKFKPEQEQEKFDFETALELQKKLDEREEVKAKEAHDIDWSDPSVLRYHALQNKPFSVAEVRKNMCMYLKNQGSEKKTGGKLKRAGQDVVEEPAKRQKTTEALESVQEQPSEEPKADELSQEQLQQMMFIVPEEGMHIEALQIKYPIIDWEVHSEDTMKFWKIIRVGNHTKVYQVFEDMLKNFNREDLDKLWSLVKERFKLQDFRC